MSVLVESEAIKGCPLIAQLAGTLCTIPFAPTIFFPSILPLSLSAHDVQHIILGSGVWKMNIY